MANNTSVKRVVVLCRKTRGGRWKQGVVAVFNQQSFCRPMFQMNLMATTVQRLVQLELKKTRNMIEACQNLNILCGADHFRVFEGEWADERALATMFDTLQKRMLCAIETDAEVVSRLSKIGKPSDTAPDGNLLEFLDVPNKPLDADLERRIGLDGPIDPDPSGLDYPVVPFDPDIDAKLGATLGAVENRLANSLDDPNVWDPMAYQECERP